MTDITSIPLNKLVVWEDNVRRTAVMDASLQNSPPRSRGARIAAIAGRAQAPQR